MWKSRRIASAQDCCRRWRERNRPGLLDEGSKTANPAAPAYSVVVDEEEEEEIEISRLVSCGVTVKDSPFHCQNVSSFRRPPTQAGKALAASLGTFLSSHLRKLPGSCDLRSHCNAFRRKCSGSVRSGVTCFNFGFPVKEEKIDVGAICTHLCELGIHVNEPVLRTLRNFSLQELNVATSHFGTANVVRKGSSGSVYRGSLASTGESIAVKVLNTRLKDARLSFGRELEMMYHIHHDHIQPLLGYCIEEHNLLLVSSYMPRGSVDRWLHYETPTGVGVDNQCKLSWDDRVKVALGIAKALHYLHTECNPAIIHRDVKPSNILLSAYNEPKLTDFGLAMKASSPYLMCEEVMGTFGYLSPEYFQYGKVSTKMDVYSFGIVLLELLTGRYPIEHANLAIWARHLLINSQDFIFQMADPLLGISFSVTDMHRMLSIGVLCIHPLDSCRPTIGKVLRLMQEEPAGSLQYLVSEAYQGACSIFIYSPISPSMEKASKAYDAELRKQYLEMAMQDIDGLHVGSPLINF